MRTRIQFGPSFLPTASFTALIASFVAVAGCDGAGMPASDTAIKATGGESGVEASPAALTVTVSDPGVTQTGPISVTSHLAPCGTMPSDAPISLIPSKFSESGPSHSGSGFYGYRDNCPYWIAEYWITQNSNGGNPVSFEGVPFDLPSADADETPLVPKDCDSENIEYRILVKQVGAASFEHVFAVQKKANWANNGCHVFTNAYSPQTRGDIFQRYLVAPPSGPGVLVVRVLARVKLRSSWQEVGVKVRPITPVEGPS